MSELAVVVVGAGLAYMAYRQIQLKGEDLQNYQAGLFRETDLARMDKAQKDRMDYNSEAPDPSLDHWCPEYRTKVGNRPVRVNPDSKPSCF